MSANTPPEGLLGYRIRHLRLAKTPYGLPEQAVYSFNFALTWVLNVFNRTAWGLVPVLAEDVEGDDVETEVMPHGSGEALQLAAQFNRAFAPKGDR